MVPPFSGPAGHFWGRPACARRSLRSFFVTAPSDRRASLVDAWQKIFNLGDHLRPSVFAIDVVEPLAAEFLRHVTEMGTRLRAGLEQMIPNHDHLFESVRGVGLMLGLKMKSDSRAFVGHARSHGILTVAAGDNVVRLLPPLIIEERHVREAIDKLSAAARAYVPAQAA